MRYLYKLAVFFFLLFLCFSSVAQQWSEPVQINTLQGYNSNPDFHIDKIGTIHCVWSYKIEANHRIIYYSKSTDDGQTWSTPENVSQNTDLWMENPHIVADSQNNVHLSYDINVGNSSATLIVHRKFNGNTWSDADTVSLGWPGARHNRLVIDHNDKLYCFWFHEYQGGTVFYKTLENDQWGELMMVYDNNDLFFFMKGTVDSMNNIYCSGVHHYDGQGGYDDRIISFNFIDGEWSDWVQLSDNTSWGGNDIAIDYYNNPQIVWRQEINDSIPPDHGTHYSKFDSGNWSYPAMIAENSDDQAIAIDKNNEVHIVDNEKSENGYNLVHYQIINNEWVGEIINEDNYGFFVNKLSYREQYLYLLNIKVDTVIGACPESSINISKFEITTNIENSFTPSINYYKIYPNPTSGKTTISYNLNTAKHTSIIIYSLKGELIKTIIDKKLAPGVHKTKWNGTDKNGKEVKNGLYLVRLQVDKQIMTRSVELIK